MSDTFIHTNIAEEFIDFSFPASLYMQLKTICHIPFTPREVDILACIQSGRTTKTIASLLLISPRTVENHIRNIMLKIRCSSQEHIIDFIEKSDKFTLIKQYYSALVIQVVFEKELKKSFLQLNEKLPSCMLMCNKDQAEEMFVIPQLEKYLKMLGVKVTIYYILDINNNFLINHAGIFNDIDYIISFLPKNFLNEPSPHPYIEMPGNFYFAQLAKQEEKPTLFLFSNKNLIAVPKEILNYDYIELETQGNYYLLIFAILKKVLTKIDFDKHIKEFSIQHDKFLDFKIHQANRNISDSKEKITINNINGDEDRDYRERDNKVRIYSRLLKNKLLYGLFSICLIFCILLFHKKIFYSEKNIAITTNNIKNISSTSPMDNELSTWNVPRHDNKFVGRKELLEKMADYFKPTTNINETPKTVVTVLSGMGGVGKSQLALQYLYHPVKSYTFKMWLCAENKEQFKRKMIVLAKHLGFLNEDTSFQENISSDMAINYVKQWLCLHPGWLLVLDNVHSYDDIMSLLPEEGGHIILTTRNRQWPSNFNVLPVNVMQEEEAIDLVKVLVHKTLNPEEEFDVKKIVKALGYLPLTLAQAGTFIQNKAININDYLTLYEQYEHDLLANNSMPEGTDHIPTAITWNVSIEAIEKEMEVRHQQSIARHILTACAFLSPNHIPRIILLEWLKKVHPDISQPELVLIDTLSLLSKYSLIDLSQDTVSMHRLVQAVLRQQYLSNTNVNKKYPLLNSNWFINLFETLDEALWDENKIAKYERMQQLFPHFQSLTEHYKKINANQNSVTMGYALCDIGWILQYYFFDISAAKIYFDQSLTILEQHPKEAERMSKVLNTIGIIYRESGQTAKAIEFIEKSLKIKKKLFGEEHMEVAIGLNSLGMVYLDAHQLPYAKKTLEQSLKIKEKIMGINHINVASTLTNLAILYHEQKNLAYAKSLLERALNIQSSVFPNYDDIYIGKTLTYLGTIHLELGNPKLAESFLEKALIIREKFCGKDHINVAVTLDNLGTVYKALGKIKQAETVLARAILIKKSYDERLQRLKN